VRVRVSTLWRRDLSCRDAVRLVTDYLEGALSASRRARFERHLGECDGCEEYLREMQLTVALLGRLEPTDVRPEALEALAGVFRAVMAEEQAEHDDRGDR